MALLQSGTRLNHISSAKEKKEKLDTLHRFQPRSLFDPNRATAAELHRGTVLGLILWGLIQANAYNLTVSRFIDMNLRLNSKIRNFPSTDGDKNALRMKLMMLQLNSKCHCPDSVNLAFQKS